MLDAPAAPRSAAQTRQRPAEEGIDDQSDEKKIKGQQPAITGTGTNTMEVQDTMDGPNDPGGSSSTSPPIIIVPDIPT
eukprot:16061596-Heterocapsa_arctica.AAC.1